MVDGYRLAAFGGDFYGYTNAIGAVVTYLTVVIRGRRIHRLLRATHPTPAPSRVVWTVLFSDSWVQMNGVWSSIAPYTMNDDPIEPKMESSTDDELLAAPLPDNDTVLCRSDDDVPTANGQPPADGEFTATNVDAVYAKPAKDDTAAVTFSSQCLPAISESKVIC